MEILGLLDRSESPVQLAPKVPKEKPGLQEPKEIRGPRGSG